MPIQTGMNYFLLIKILLNLMINQLIEETEN